MNDFFPEFLPGVNVLTQAQLREQLRIKFGDYFDFTCLFYKETNII